jgi:hypothetical protein
MTRVLLLLLAATVFCAFYGCGSESPPELGATIVETSPANGATDISPYPAVAVRFSAPMNAATIDTLSFYIEGVRARAIVYDDADHIATLYPVTVLAPQTPHTVHVDDTIEDAEGVTLDHVFAFTFTTGPLDCEHLGDRFEPNGNIATATPVEIDTDYYGISSCGADDADYFRFTLTDTAKVNVVTEGAYVDSEEVYWKVNFWREDGDYYATRGTSIKSAGAHPPGLDYTFLPGTYYVETGRYYGDAHKVVYHLKLETGAPAPDDQYEDNDFPDEARPISPGLHESLRGAYVDRDMFSLDLDAGQTLTVTATEVTATGTTRRLEIMSESGATYTGHSDHVNPAVETWTAAKAGKYLICVTWWSDNVIYNLDVQVSG